MTVSPRLHPLAQQPHVVVQPLPVVFHRDPVDAYRSILPEPLVSAFQGWLIDVSGQCKDLLRISLRSFRYPLQFR